MPSSPTTRKGGYYLSAPSHFLPEGNDRVDPKYDFVTDTHSREKSNWDNEVYAHQLLLRPSCDGLLVSLNVIKSDDSNEKRIRELGVHRFLRVPPQFPVMGDCGAFGYLAADTPPYTTEEVIRDYTDLGFDLAVSVDHMIVAETMAQKDARYQLTKLNAEKFIELHRSEQLKWKPVGSVQGWDAISYAEAARDTVNMGYDYIAVGGLVRSPNEQIIKILTRVYEAIKGKAKIHLFGVARLNQLKLFAALGVSSLDGTTPLRRAWLGAKDNYWTLARNPLTQAYLSYRAVRIPQLEDRWKLGATGQRAEQRALETLRSFDREEATLEETLQAVSQYDALIHLKENPLNREQYRRTLEDAPWRDCKCEICQQIGIEVIIYRGRNRNWRRGFHMIGTDFLVTRRTLIGLRATNPRKVSIGNPVRSEAAA